MDTTDVEKVITITIKLKLICGSRTTETKLSLPLEQTLRRKLEIVKFEEKNLSKFLNFY